MDVVSVSLQTLCINFVLFWCEHSLYELFIDPCHGCIVCNVRLTVHAVDDDHSGYAKHTPHKYEIIEIEAHFFSLSVIKVK